MTKSKIEEILKKNVGDYVLVRYLLPNGEPESVSGKLIEINEELIKVKGVTIAVLNRSVTRLIEVILRAGDKDKKD